MATKKAATKPTKKVATKPVKKVAAPAKKVAKPVASKKVASKPAAKKPAPKPVAKKSPVPKKSAPKPVAKPAAKPAAKKPVAAVKKVASKPVVKAPAKSVSKAPVAKAKPVVAVKHVAEIKKPAVKQVVAVKPAVKPVAKPSGLKATAKNPKDIKIEPAKPVSIPKLATKASRKYTPDFTKSVLDQQARQESLASPIVRYSDNELAEFKELILRKLEAAKKELVYLQGLITRKDDQGGDDTDNRYMTMEDGSLSMEREQLSQMASRQITYTDNLQKALVRIENKTYGICRETGKLIDKARLRAVPHATLSIEAKMARGQNR